MVASQRQARMVELMGVLAPDEGYTLCSLPGVKFMRTHSVRPRSPALVEPCIVIVCQGHKRGYLGGEAFDYHAQQFLVLSVPLPFEGEPLSQPSQPWWPESLAEGAALVATLSTAATALAIWLRVIATVILYRSSLQAVGCCEKSRSVESRYDYIVNNR